MSSLFANLEATGTTDGRRDTMDKRETLEQLFKGVWPSLTERERRLFAAAQAREWGYGGISLVSSICGLSRTTISKGMKELNEPMAADGRVRRPGAGRPNLLRSDQALPSVLSQVLEKGETMEGGRRPPLSWTLKSTRALARELSEAKHPLSYVKAGQLLRELGFSLKSNKRVGKGAYRVDAATQYGLINREVSAALREGLPVIYLRRVPLGPKASQDPWPEAKRVPGDGRGVPGLAMDLLCEWWEGGGSSGYPDGAGLLFIVNDSVTPAPAGGPAATLWESSKGCDLPMARFLDFPVGTHRWNLALGELFSIVSGTISLGKGARHETSAFLLSWEPGAQSRKPGRYVLESPGDAPPLGSC
jgi:hypothetical protein